MRLPQLWFSMLALIGVGGFTPPAHAQGTFNPLRSTWSRISERELPAEPIVEPTAKELAAELGLVADGHCDVGTPLYRHEKLGMHFVFVPGGRFLMGSDHFDLKSRPGVKNAAARAKEPDQLKWEQPKVEVYVSSFFLGFTEVTVAQYREFLKAVDRGEVAPHEFPQLDSRGHIPHMWDEVEGYYEPEHPASAMTWFSAYAFCDWMGGRLPTEAEWERAASGDDDRLFPWGNLFSSQRANTAECGVNRPVPVGTYPGGRSPYGCRNMAGNVCEYVMDAFERTTFRHVPRSNPCLLVREPASDWDWRVVKGGSHNPFVGFMHRARGSSRSRLRSNPVVDRNPIGAAVDDFLHWGFRVALSPNNDLFPEGWMDQRRQEIAALRAQRDQDAAQTGRNSEEGGQERAPEASANTGTNR